MQSDRTQMLSFMRWSVEVGLCLFALFAFVPAAANVVQNRLLVWFTPRTTGPMRVIGPVDTFEYFLSPWIMLVSALLMMPFVIHFVGWWVKSRRRAVV